MPGIIFVAVASLWTLDGALSVQMGTIHLNNIYLFTHKAACIINIF